MDTCARHFLVELFGCDPDRLNDAEGLRALLRAGAEAAGAQVVAEVFHPFAPHGVTGVVVIEESHLSIHTWPESGYAAVDFYTCGDVRPPRAIELLSSQLRATRVELLEIARGGAPEQTLSSSSRSRLL